MEAVSGVHQLVGEHALRRARVSGLVDAERRGGADFAEVRL